MKKTMITAGLVVLVLASLLAFAPIASASETGAPGDVPGCTTTYLDTMGGPYPVPLPEVTYTPPATVQVSADEFVNFAVAVGVRAAFATYDYVWCVV